eukprot:3857849-Amphidinium_carterae.1
MSSGQPRHCSICNHTAQSFSLRHQTTGSQTQGAKLPHRARSNTAYNCILRSHAMGYYIIARLSLFFNQKSYARGLNSWPARAAMMTRSKSTPETGTGCPEAEPHGKSP